MAEWYTCHVTLTGPAEDGAIYIRLRPTADEFPEGWFRANPTHKREMLAVALTSLTVRSPVRVWLTDTIEYSQIDRLYVHRPT